MSSILKALKKLEDEKTVRKPDSLNIDADILRGDTSTRMSLTGVSLVAALVFICGSGATYFYMKKAHNGEQPPKSSIVTSERLSSTLPAPQDFTINTQNKNNELTDSQRQIQPPIPNQTQHRTAIMVQPPSATSKQPVVKTQPKSQNNQQHKTAVTNRLNATGQHTAAPVTKIPSPTMVPSIKVNGIAYQDGGVDSVAVVNGISVSSGSMIEGAKVEDIQKDRVQFSYGGNKFEVPLGKSNR